MLGLLKQTRMNAGVTQAQASLHLGYSCRQAYTLIETGVQLILPHQLTSLHDLFVRISEQQNKTLWKLHEYACKDLPIGKRRGKQENKDAEPAKISDME